jgi:hypothetical protein
VRQHRVSAFDFERRLIDLVERVAVDYEADIGISRIVHAVRDAREEIAPDAAEATDGGLALIESRARQRLDALTRQEALAAVG